MCIRQKDLFVVPILVVVTRRRPSPGSFPGTLHIIPFVFAHSRIRIPVLVDTVRPTLPFRFVSPEGNSGIDHIPFHFIIIIEEPIIIITILIIVLIWSRVATCTCTLGL
jgi:hypothetical protein